MAKKKHKEPAIMPAWMTAYCSSGLPLPEQEYKFAAERRFAFDFAWTLPKVALEIEGGIYGRGKACPLCKRRWVGAHTSIARLKSDMEKYNMAAVLGWHVIRVRPEQVKSGEVLQWLDAALLRIGKKAA